MSLLRPEQLADELQTTRQNVMRRVASGEFPCIRIGKRVRFTAAHVEQIIASHEVAAKDEPADAWGRVTRRTRRSA